MSDRIFVFGSNLLGVHGAGAAKMARDHYGAETGIGEGRTGNAYAIPTKGTWRDQYGLPLKSIEAHVQTFLAYAREHPELVFQVTRVGCGRAGYRDDQIAPFFLDAPSNCDLPLTWRQTRRVV